MYSFESDPAATRHRRGRNLILLLGGLFMITVAMALLVVGSGLLDGSKEKASMMEQIPASDGLSAPSDSVATGRLLEIGDRPGDFELSDLDGETVRLSDLRGRPVLLNFWATWCAPCRLEMPELQAAFERHQEDGLVILAIDLDESAEAVRAFFYDEMGLTFTPLLDADGRVTESYGVFNFPSSFFIDPDGVVRSIHRGPMVQRQIEDHLSTILPGSS